MMVLFYLCGLLALILASVVANYFMSIWGEIEISDSKATYKDERGTFILSKENLLDISWGFHPFFKKRYYKITISISGNHEIKGCFFETITESGGSISEMIGRIFQEKPYPTLVKLIELGLYKPKPDDPFFLSLKLKSKINPVD